MNDRMDFESVATYYDYGYPPYHHVFQQLVSPMITKDERMERKQRSLSRRNGAGQTILLGTALMAAVYAEDNMDDDNRQQQKASSTSSPRKRVRRSPENETAMIELASSLFGNISVGDIEGEDNVRQVARRTSLSKPPSRCVALRAMSIEKSE